MIRKEKPDSAGSRKLIPKEEKKGDPARHQAGFSYPLERFLIKEKRKDIKENLEKEIEREPTVKEIHDLERFSRMSFTI